MAPAPEPSESHPGLAFHQQPLTWVSKGNMLNMTDNVHPYHWDVQSFEELIGLAPEAEFDLIVVSRRANPVL